MSATVDQAEFTLEVGHDEVRLRVIIPAANMGSWSPDQITRFFERVGEIATLMLGGEDSEDGEE